MASSVPFSPKLTPNFFQTYKEYKLTTKVIVDWLSFNSGHRPGTDAFWEVDDLYEFALKIKQSCIEAPNIIRRAFTDTIRARRDVAAFYKASPQSSEQDNERHEHFTATCTADEELEEFNIQILSEYQDTQIARQQSKEPLQARSRKASSIADDNLNWIMLSLVAVQTLDRACDFIKSLWESAAHEATPLPFLALLSVYTDAHIQARYNDLPCSSLEGLNREFTQASPEILRTVLPEGSSLDRSLFFGGSGLRLPLQAWDRFKNTTAAKEARDKPTDFIMRSPVQMEDFMTGERHYRIEIETSAMLRFLQGAQRWTEHNGLELKFRQQINPLLSMIQPSLNGEEGLMTGLAFGMQLMTEIHRTQLWGVDSPPSRSNYRISSLKFAQDVKKEVEVVLKTSWPCPCHSCRECELLLQLAGFLGLLEAYGGIRSFDLYSQNPWVAGTHMLQFLIMATDFGLRLCDLNDYLGVILHLYNALRQLKVIESPVPILERICSVLELTLFSGGGQPTAKFYNRFMRFCGVEVKAPKKKKGKGPLSTTQVYEWEHRKPDYKSRHGKEPGRLQAKDFSIIFCMVASGEKGWTTIGHDFWIERIYKRPDANKKERQAILAEASGLDPAPMLRKTADAIRPEFVGEFPVSMINWFAVFHMTQRTVTAMFRDELKHQTISKTKGGVPDHPDLVELPLTIDWIKWALCEIDNGNPCEFLEIAKNGILEAVQGKELSDFLWKM
ncbi:MAG: hypothetical protein Q9225_006330 [Loekoesia sp. 1 TL-2023]